MHPHHHDQACALTSHLPHLLSNAFCLGTASWHNEVEHMAGPSFQDLYRVAGSPPLIWKDIFLTNRDNILNALDLFLHNLTELADTLRNNDEQALIEILERARTIKEKKESQHERDTMSQNTGRES